MGWQGWFTLVLVLATVAALASERFSPPAVVMGALTVLLLSGVIDARSALSGFSNEAPFTIAALYVVAAAAQTTGALERLTARVLRNGRSHEQRPGAGTTARVLTPFALVSAFVYNTPTVATLAPRVAEWARRTGRPASWYLLPLNHAVLLGGMVTAIGTTTNVVISGLLSGSRRSPLALFEPLPALLPVAVAGMVVLCVLTPVTARRRRAATESFGGDAREFTVEMVVCPRSPLDGQHVEDAGLRNLEGVYLVAVMRGEDTITPVAPDRVLRGGDRLVFAGNVARVVDLQRIRGLGFAADAVFEAGGGATRFFEAVVGGASTLVGETLKGTGFRAKYGAAVVAIHRHGELVQSKLGGVSLRAGDVLLVVGTGDFRQRWHGSGDFLLVSPLDGEATPLDRRRALLVELLMLGFLLAAATGVLSVLKAALVAALAVVGLGVLTPWQARRAIDVNVLVVVCGSFGIGEAVGQSGLAAQVARLLVDALQPLGDRGVLAGVLVATVLITQVVTNNAAAVLMYPIALATAAGAHLAERPFILALVVGASASFLTPIGYQTNTIVYGMGGYRWSDFLRTGLPVLLVVTALAAVTIPLAAPLR